MTTIYSPADEDTVRKLKLGQTVHIRGKVITARDEAHMHALSAGNEAEKIFRNATVFHCGPIVTKDNEERKIIAAGPTTSARMNKLTAEMIRRYGIRIIIGKGGMSDDVLNVMKEEGCVYLAAIGGAAVSLAECLNVNDVKWEELGMAEAVWVLDAKDMGPLIVAMDAHGNSLYKDVNSKVSENMRDHS